MELLKKKILEEGEVIGDDILKVDSFLNHQLDIKFLNEVGKEFWLKFRNDKVTKILTIESSGIAIAVMAAQYFDVPVVFAKKNISRNLETEIYTSEVFSFTKGTTYQIKVAKKYITAEDRILIIDDFLANGRAVLGLKDIIEQAGANLIGAGIVIEKGFQQGGKNLREAGVNVYSLAIIESMKGGKIVFREN
ncbi:xanthine phosphoribosyltransferase [Thermosyntropha sp.]|uniref:xanthine phosphoribosyltransferase n=1 Tax=Thermosyntropha sp. TaxID=2740820 RepID=UPI0025D5C106|nr:xanthine phosphoribosyltransferase [Thermosyntropha sp.]MBO8159984.1 xanthine phosphoribosyltransferase [Thermosyntropha sp.]